MRKFICLLLLAVLLTTGCKTLSEAEQRDQIKQAEGAMSSK